MKDISKIYYDSPIGILELSATKKGLCGLYFVDEKKSAEKSSRILRRTARQLDKYFKGKRERFKISLDIQGTAFQQKVWKELLKIPYGSTKSYLDIAKHLGDPKAIRAVGSANGKNKISIIIPCHRVIGDDGSMVGYGGGIWRKKWLLEHEAKYIQGSLF